MTIEEMPEGGFRHPAAIVETSRVGRGTRVWAFAHILPGARIGEDCNVCDHVFIENDVSVGNRVTLKCGVQLWDGVTIDDDVFVGPNATFTNDPFPRSRRRPERYTPTFIRKGASIGANATILCGLTVGANAVVGAGAVVTHDVPPNAIVVGNPAHIRGYVDTEPEIVGRRALKAVAERPQALPVGGVRVYQLSEFTDLRGSLLVGEFGKDLPFEPRRFFVVHGVPSRNVRGEHAHRTLQQFLVCLEGECSLVVDDGKARQEIHLASPSTGVYLPPLVWGIQYKFSPDAMLLVLASEAYDPAEYIRDYDEFLRLVRGTGS